MADDDKSKLKGLMVETLPSGNVRYRVRVKGKPSQKITLATTPDNDDFLPGYRAARQGVQLKKPKRGIQTSQENSLIWLANTYMTWMATEVERGNYSRKTLKKRRQLLNRFTDYARLLPVDIPRHELIKLRDHYSETPSMADDMIAALSIMFDFGIERDYCKKNTAKGIKNFGRKGNGSTPWTRADFSTFTDTHKPGSTAYLCLHLLAFTACRIGDARLLGRRNETMRDGVKFLEWQPEKKGAAFVSVPMMPQLQDAIRRCGNQETYLRNSWDKPFSSGDALSQVFSKWCKQAGMENRTAHGVRKAVGHLLAEAGCSQYQIMAIHGHTESRTSEVYTIGVQRRKLAIQAMQSMESLEL